MGSSDNYWSGNAIGLQRYWSYINGTLDSPKKMVRRDVPLNAEPAKQRSMRYRPIAHQKNILLNP